MASGHLEILGALLDGIFLASLWTLGATCTKWNGLQLFANRPPTNAHIEKILSKEE